ncbi:MAG TPA: DUF5753 domain-containing protein, partial [Acidimicrobiales bacterium]
GERQALYANLEAGAQTIREFQMIFIPGLLQTPDYTRARGEAERVTGAGEFRADKAADGRLGRQRMLRRPGGPLYEVVIDELALRRASAPREILKAQLYHIAATVNGNPKITARVLPVEAHIDGFSVPRSAFSIYTFTDPGDPTIVTVDTITDDMILNDSDHVKRYEELYDRLRDASMSMSESLEFMISWAKNPRS